MAFPVGWLRQCPLVIQHGQVTGDQTGFPILLTNATNCLPAEMVTTGDPHAAQSDGGDIRFSSDSLGVTQLPCEIVQFVQNATASSAVVEIWVQASILTGTDVTIYIWYQAGGGLSQPAANAAFGSQAVWDSHFKTVSHFGDGTTLSLADSTANANTATNHSGTAAAGQHTGGVNFSAQTNYLGWGSGATPSGATSRTIEMWWNGTGSGLRVWFDQGTVSAGKRLVILTFGGGADVSANSGDLTVSSSTVAVNDGAWHLLTVLAHSASGLFTIYVDGVLKASPSSGGSLNTDATPIDLNQSIGGGTGQVGTYDEFRASDIERSATWASTTYNCQNSPGAFTHAGSPTSPSSGSSLFRPAPLSGLGTGGPFFSNPLE